MNLLVVIYLAFISLGLPDPMLGSAWPGMYGEMGVTLGAAGTLNTIISVGTVISSLLSDRMNDRWGTGRVTAFSVGMTAAALFGFALSHSFWQLCLWAIPYGLGAGGVDAALNNYVALHYASRHMSWLHCMWGIGSAIGPFVVGQFLRRGGSWNSAFLAVGVFQSALTVLIAASIPRWKRAGEQPLEPNRPAPRRTVRRLLSIPGAKVLMTAFFCYCSMEWTAVLWTSSYLSEFVGLTQQSAATFSSLLLAGMALGRFLGGFLVLPGGDDAMVRLGSRIAAAGALMMLLLPLPALKLVGLFLLGLGFAPIYPSVIHATPIHFGAENSQALIGLQMAGAYVGTCVMPQLFGTLAEWIGTGFLPLFLLLLLVLMRLAYDRMEKQADAANGA